VCSSDLIKALTVVCDDGTELILEFDETNRPIYRMETNYTADYQSTPYSDGTIKVHSGREFMEHEIRWIENVERPARND
jgi:hypothetical protein